MRPNSFLCVFLVISCQIQGSSAGNHVFVEKGKDVLLEIMAADLPEKVVLLSWSFNKNNVLVTFSPNGEPNVFDAYTGRVEPSGKNYSVILKNLQEADSGVYTARVIGAQEKIVAEYNVTVQDPVSPVKLTVDSVSNSSDSCNLTVTCSTQDSHHINSTFTCDTKTCSQEGGERSKVTTSGASLQVFLFNDSIICNHSNQISWVKDTKRPEIVCSQYRDPEAHRNHVIAVVILSVLVAVIAAAIAAFFYRKKRKDQRENLENTVYASPEPRPTTQPRDQSPAGDASGPSTSLYSMVGSHNGPTGSTETRVITMPNSVYAQIEKIPTP